MRPREDVFIAIWSIGSRPVRSILMALTLGAGVAAVALSAAILEGFAQDMERLSFGAYSRSIVITPNYYNPDRAVAPGLDDLNRVTDALSGRVEGAAAWRIGYRVPASSASARMDLDVYGVLGDYRFEADMPLASGRLLEPRDLESTRRVCLLGQGAADTLFPGGARPGHSIRVNGVSCEVGGVFGAGDTRVAGRFSNAVIAPFHVSARYFMPAELLAPREASRLTVVLRDKAELRDASIQTDRVLRRAHGAPQSQASPFLYADPAVPLASLERQRDMMARLLLAIAAITLVASTVGYGTNTWATAETRRRDIGLQMASGAYPGDIFLQFSIESLMLGLLGGLTGTICAFLAGQLIHEFWGWTVVFNGQIFALAFCIGMLSGFVSGVVPAWRAASLLPATTVRG
mgnify:CR=1 FL=1